MYIISYINCLTPSVMTKNNSSTRTLLRHGTRRCAVNVIFNIFLVIDLSSINEGFLPNISIDVVSYLTILSFTSCYMYYHFSRYCLCGFCYSVQFTGILPCQSPVFILPHLSENEILFISQFGHLWTYLRDILQLHKIIDVIRLFKYMH